MRVTHDYSGIDFQSLVVALGQEGVDQCKKMFGKLSQEALVLKSDLGLRFEDRILEAALDVVASIKSATAADL